MAHTAKSVAAALCLVFLNLVVAAESKRLVCYYGSWSVYRPGDGKFDVEDIDPNICTHLMYGFVGLGNDSRIRINDPWNDLPDDWGKAAFRRFVGLKQKNPSLKTLVAVGGWNDGSERYSTLLSDPAKRSIFVQDALSFVRKHGFDGLDMDWEYPNQRGGVYSDVNIFTELLRELRTEFNKYGLLLTAAVASAEASFTKSYDIPAISQYLDFINIMAYDFHGAWENVTGHNAPMYSSAALKGTEFEGFSVNDGIQAWLRYGAPAEKLVMGVGLYGRTFTLADPSCYTPRCPAKEGAPAGQWTREPGMLGYNEICLIEKQSNAATYWDSEQQAPYTVAGTSWMGYDNEDTVRMKMDYIKQNRLGGGMVWSIETDDFRGSCGKGRYPLLSIMNKALVGYTDPAPTTAAPTTAAPTTAAPTTAAPTTAAPTTAAPAPTTAAPAPTTAAPAPTTAAPAPTTAAPAPTTAAPAPTTAAPAPTTAAPATTAAPVTNEVCQKVGYNRDPNNCQVFYQCSLNKGVYKYTKFTCSKGLLFDTTLEVCNFADQVQC